MTLHHAPSDPPRVCWACVDDAVNAPDEPMPEHDPEIAGTDEDGPYCVCGHHVTRVRPSPYVPTTSVYRFTIWHDSDTPPPPHVLSAAASVIAAALGAAGIVAAVTIDKEA